MKKGLMKDSSPRDITAQILLYLRVGIQQESLNNWMWRRLTLPDGVGRGQTGQPCFMRLFTLASFLQQGLQFYQREAGLRLAFKKGAFRF